MNHHVLRLTHLPVFIDVSWLNITHFTSFSHRLRRLLTMLFESRSQALAKSLCHDCLDKNSHGVFRCEGCEKKFCLKHTNEHRSMLKAHLNELAEEQREFFNEIQDQKPISTKLFEQIDQWEKTIDRTNSSSGERSSSRSSTGGTKTDRFVHFFSLRHSLFL